MIKQLALFARISVCVTLLALGITAQTQTFTYQGSLKSGSVAVSGTYDFEFGIYNSAAGSDLLATYPRPQVAVVNGIFTVSLPAEAAIFSGGAKYLEIRVKIYNPSNPDLPYETLAPRQLITSAPYAVKSLNSTTATTAENVSGVVPVANGGTGAATSADARLNLGLGSLATVTPTGTADSNTFLRGDNTWSSGPVGPVGPQGPPGPAGPTDIVASINTQFSEDDRSAWVHVETLGDDTCVSNIPLGFTFTGWGRANTTVSFSSNGVLFLGPGCVTNFSNTALPSSMSNDPFVALFWDDLRDFGSSEYMEYQTLGSPGGRVFNLYFRSRLLSTVCGTDAIVMMAAIHEGSNLIRISHTVTSGCAEIRGGAATFGIQGPGGDTARAFIAGVNSPILDDNLARNMISYLPPRQ